MCNKGIKCKQSGLFYPKVLKYCFHMHCYNRLGEITQLQKLRRVKN